MRYLSWMSSWSNWTFALKGREIMMDSVQKSADTYCNLDLTINHGNVLDLLNLSKHCLSVEDRAVWMLSSSQLLLNLLNFVDGVVNHSCERHNVRFVSASILGEFSSSHSHTWTAARSPACSTHILQASCSGLDVVNIFVQRNSHSWCLLIRWLRDCDVFMQITPEK